MSMVNMATTKELGVSQDRSDLIKKSLGYKLASLSPNTWRSYKSMWKKFVRWCEANPIPDNNGSVVPGNLLPANADTISCYLGDIGEHVSFSTLDASIAAIEKIHKESGHSIEGDPQIYRDVRKGIGKTHKEKLEVKQAPALSVVDLKIAMKGLFDGLQDTRDKAIITLGFWGAFRRSELASIQHSHLKFADEGAVITLLGSKTSDRFEEVYVSFAQDLLLCPVHNLKRWLGVAGVNDGPVFRSLMSGGKVSDKQLSGHSVSHIMKRVFDEDHSGHSLRRGVITETAKKGVPVREIQKFSRHESVDMVLRYAEKAKGFEYTTGKALGV